MLDEKRMLMCVSIRQSARRGRLVQVGCKAMEAIEEDYKAVGRRHDEITSRVASRWGSEDD